MHSSMELAPLKFSMPCEPMDPCVQIVSDLRPGTNVYPIEYVLEYLFAPSRLLWLMEPSNIPTWNIGQEKVKTQKLSLSNP